MDHSTRFRVVIVHPNGLREIRARNLSLETAQAIETMMYRERKVADVILEPDDREIGYLADDNSEITGP